MRYKAVFFLLGVLLAALPVCGGPAADDKAAAARPAAGKPAAKPAKKSAKKPAAKPAKKPAKPLAFDGFDGKLLLDWKVLRPDRSHYSLKKKASTLTITTQQGRLSGSHTDYENLFLVKSPPRAEKNCHVTLCLRAFLPEALAQQAGLIFFNDEDNYLKCVYIWQDNARRVEIGCEREGRLSSVRVLIEQAPKALWIRAVKQGDRYTFLTSLDGKAFRKHWQVAWGDGSVAQVGLLAKNAQGGGPEIDASFDSFQVAALAAKTAKDPKGFFIAKARLELTDDMKPCAARLRKLYQAIRKYENQKGKPPDWMTDLFPAYLAANVALCPSDTKHQGYGYEFKADMVPSHWGGDGKTSMRQWKQRQVKRFGDVVPLVRCERHGSGRVLNITVSGKMYWGQAGWEQMFRPCYRFSDDFPKPPKGRKEAAAIRKAVAGSR